MKFPLTTATARDDRLLPITRVVAACIVPFLLAAFFVLYVRPELSGERFAWNVQPRFTAYWIGSGYLGGAWFFFRVIRAPRWHQVTLGLPAIWAFVCLMLAATLLHWERFDTGRFAFQVWLALYVITPLLIPALWCSNRRHDPKQPDAAATIVPRGLRAVLGCTGGVLVALALWMFLLPQSVIPLWSWKLTPLTARVMAGWFTLSGVTGLSLAFEPRWTAWRIVLQSMMVCLAALTIGIWRAWPEFDMARPAFGAVLTVPLSLISLASLYVLQERKTAAARQTGHAVVPA